MKYINIINECIAQELAQKANLDISKYDMNELCIGIDVEREHNQSNTDVVKDDTDLLKIAVVHLQENPTYYSILKKAGL